MERTGGGSTNLTIARIAGLLVGIAQYKVGKSPQCLMPSSSVEEQGYSSQVAHVYFRGSSESWWSKQPCDVRYICADVVTAYQPDGVCGHYPQHLIYCEGDSSFSPGKDYLHTSVLSAEWDRSGHKECGLAHSRYFATAALVRDIIKHDLWLTEIFWQKISISSCAERF